ncbi:MAG: hypothetical protein EA416_07375 [Trueperaceae bacterium]|nr:MAG: hypothetical protein EA416_07375 [Trueperaceae bacterium]
MRIVVSSGLRRDDESVCAVPGGFDVGIGGALQQFRCERVPRERWMDAALGAPASPDDDLWRWSVETSFEIGAEHRLVLGGDAARGFDARVHAGSAQQDGDQLRLRAHVSAFDPSDLRVMTLLAPVARRQRDVAFGVGLDAASIAPPALPGPRSARDAAQLDALVEAFGDLEVTATHVLEQGLVRVRLPWSTLGPDPNGDRESTSVLRAETDSDVLIDVHAPIRSVDGPGALVETRLPVPEHVGEDQAERWTAWMNAEEFGVGAAGPAIGAWSLAELGRPWRQRAWVHRCVVQNLAGAPPWPLIADLALRRVRWAVGEHAERYHHHEAEERPWARWRSSVSNLRAAFGLDGPAGADPASLTRRVPYGEPTLSLTSHLWGCARARRSGPWIEHVARAAGLVGAGRTVDRGWVEGRLDRWLVETGVATAGQPWAWSFSGSASAPVGEPAPFRSRLPDDEVHNLLARAEAADIAVSWRTPLRRGALGYATQLERRGGVRSERPPLRGAWGEGYRRVPIGRFEVAVDTAASAVPYAEVLVHELAHVLLGHTGSSRAATRSAAVPHDRWDLGTAAIEVEVSMVVILVFARRGVRPEESIVRLLAFRDAARRARNDGSIDLWHVFAAAERLLAWCLDRPDASTVRSRDDAPVPLGGLARAVGSTRADARAYVIEKNLVNAE